MNLNEHLINKNIDNALNGVSILLTYDDENPTYRNNLLPEDFLDYSVESLFEIENYIKIVSQEKGFLKN